MSNGDFVWYDYMANDVEKALAFYSETVGWKTQSWGDDGYQMLMINNGENSVGGVMQLPEQAAQMGAPPHWLSYVAVEDVDATAKKAGELGGSVMMPPMDIPTVGRIAVLADFDGAVFGAVTFEDDGMDRPDPQQIGAFSWSELWTSNWEKAFDFYSALFGWEKDETMDMGEMGTYQIFAANGTTQGGMMNRPEKMPMSAWTYCITTDDIEAAGNRIEQNGGKIMNEPQEVPGGGKVGYWLDNQGGAFALYQGPQG